MLGGMRSMTGTPPFRDRLRQTYSNSPGPSSTTPFAMASHSHPNFAPVKLNSKGSLPKAPKAPEKPLMPYMRYSRKIWDSVKAKNPELKLWQIGKIIGQMWRELSDSERKEYNDAYEHDKAQYQENLKAFHNSAQYQNFLKEKQRAEQSIEEEERRSKSSKMDNRVSIQPADYEQDNDGGLSIKNVAAARYQRNHTLINDIFSDSLVPDGRSVVTTQRMTLLKKQVNSLMAHQEKLEKELFEINDKFEARKRKFLENSEEFRKKLKKECENKPTITPEQFEEMVSRHKREIRLKNQKVERERTLSTQSAEAVESASSVPTKDNEEASGATPVQEPTEDDKADSPHSNASQKTDCEDDDQDDDEATDEMDQS